MKPCIRARRPNAFQDRFVTPQRLAGPIRADQAEHAVINRIPLRRSRRVMRHRDRQAKFVREFLQGKLPCPFAMVVGSAAVHFDQQSPLLFITPATNIQPPAPNGCDFKAGRLLRDADHHVAIVVSQIANSYRAGSTLGPGWVIVIQYLMRTASPGTSRILEIPHQLLFLPIYLITGQFRATYQLRNRNR